MENSRELTFVGGELYSSATSARGPQ